MLWSLAEAEAVAQDLTQAEEQVVTDHQFQAKHQVVELQQSL
jgi:hypothetical protein